MLREAKVRIAQRAIALFAKKRTCSALERILEILVVPVEVKDG